MLQSMRGTLRRVPASRQPVLAANDKLVTPFGGKVILVEFF